MLRYILIGILLYYLFKWARRLLVFRFYKRAVQQNGTAQQSGTASEMIKCVRCETFISKDMASYKSDGWRCADDCSAKPH